MNRSVVARTLPWLLTLYCAASLAHFAHNAEYLADYPNLPDSFSRAGVYLAWLSILSIGILGYVLYRRGRYVTGLIALAVYAGFGFDGLLHYTLAPFAAHTFTMNLTIWTEVLAAALVFVAVVKLGIEQAGRNAF